MDIFDDNEEFAKKIIGLPKWRDSWREVLNEQSRCLFSGELAYSWRCFAMRHAVDPLEERYEDGKTFWKFRGREILVPYEKSRDDSLREVIALNKLMYSEFEIRYLIDSWHSSDLAFLVLRRGAWARIDSNFAKETVEFRFLRITEDFETLSNRLFSEHNRRKYKHDQISNWNLTHTTETPRQNWLIFALTALISLLALTKYFLGK
jgi:hypothetical protein